MRAPARPHPLARSRMAERADALLEWTWGSGLTEKPPLDPDFLWRKGSAGFSQEDENASRSAEDVADFRARLEKLCQSLREEAHLNALGHTMAYGQITSAIRKRHALGKLWRQQPDLPNTRIAPPIVVAGQMRAGTTRMHRLLAADPGHAGTPFCNALDPVPPRPDWRPAKARLGLAIARSINPWLDMLHPFGPTRVDEEIGWLSLALSPCALEAQYRIPSFVAWSEARDPQPVYREFARILRTDAALTGNADKPRILKCPQFSEDLPALLGEFADARVVSTHRSGDAVLRSSVSMVSSQMAFQSDAVVLEDIETEWQRKLALRETRMAQALDGFEGRHARVGFDALGRDWRKEIARVYETLGIELTSTASAAMEREMRQSDGGSHEAHRHQIADFANDG